MSERKVFNKYYPPDFDVRKLPKKKQDRNIDPEQKRRAGMYNIRMMMPMTVRCLTCGEYVPRGKKFNSRCEKIKDDKYLTIDKFRFYIRCPRCSSEFTIKTDPATESYLAENNCTQREEPWREAAKAKQEAKEKREEEERDAMKALENKANSSKQDAAILDALDEYKDRSQRALRLPENALDEVVRKNEEQRILTEEEEFREMIEAIKKSSKKTWSNVLLSDDDDDDNDDNDNIKNGSGDGKEKSKKRKRAEEHQNEKSAQEDFLDSVAQGLGFTNMHTESIKVGENSGSSSHNGLSTSVPMFQLSVKKQKHRHDTKEKAQNKSEDNKPIGLSLIGGYSDDEDN